MSSHSLANGSVLVEWEDTRSGWRAPRRLVRVEMEEGGRVMEEETWPGQTRVIINGLTLTNNYRWVMMVLGMLMIMMSRMMLLL